MSKRPPVKRPPRKKEESSLLASIRNTFGARPDVLLVRVNVGLFDTSGGYKVRSAPNGYPDLQLVQRRRVWRKMTRGGAFMQHDEEGWFYFGQAIYLECKAKAGKLSKDQMAFKRAAEAVGAIYVVPRSLDDVTAVLGPVPEWVTNG